MTTTEAEVTAVHAPGTAVAAYTAGQVEEYRPRIVMAPEDAKALDDQLRACMLAVLRPGVDYGTIPGMGDKPSLFKPGAEKLVQWFGFGFTSERGETERDSDGNRLGVTYRCTVTKGLPDGRTIIIATCEGYAGYDEDRFYTSAEQAWDKECALAERYKREPRKWKAAEYRAPWNTVIKMAQKRAHVGAAIDATAAAGLFTQDLEDMTPPPGRDDNDGNGAARRAPAGDDAWENSTPAPPRQGRTGGNGKPAQTPPENGQRWADTAIEQAARFKSEAEGDALWREAGARHLNGECTRGEADHIQAIVAARIADRRREASNRLLRQLSESDDWRAKVEELDGSDIQGCREALEELGRLKAAGTVDETRAGRIGRAVIALCPKAAVKAGDDGA
jgi:hypothetical protein